MAWIVAAIIGGIIGLIYGMGISVDRRLYSLSNFIIGAIGGVFGIWLFVLVFGLMTLNPGVNLLLGVIWSVIGALIVMAVIDAINYSIYKSRSGQRRGMRHSRGYGREYDIEEEEHKITRKKK